MKNFLLQSFKGLYTAMAFVFIVSQGIELQAQPMVVFDTFTGFSATAIPFSSTNANRRAWIYNPSDFNNAQPGLITRIYFLGSANVTPNFSNLTISMGPSATPNWPNFLSWPTTGMTPVINAATYSGISIPYSGLSTGRWIAFDLQTPYYYDNLTSLIIDAQQFGYNPGFSLREALAPNASIFGSASTLPTGFINTKPIFGFDWVPLPPCTTPPFLGATTASNTVVCVGNAVTLTVDSVVLGTGQTYMWQSSLDGVNWTNLPNDTLTSTAVVVMSSTYYRLGATCGGVTSFSTPVQINTITTPLSGGAYTINDALPTGGTNFSSLRDFGNIAKCVGIAGPIVLNVVPGSGPYDQQVIFDNINATAVNTITINGNGALLAFSSGISSEPATFHLKGTSFVTIDSLNVSVGNNAEIAIQLSRGASHIAIKNCTITGNLNSPVTDYAALVIGGEATPISPGIGVSSNILVENNTIIGGHYGVTLIGGGNTNRGVNNKIHNNQIQEYFSYGIYSHSQEDFEFIGNDFSRPTRLNVSTHHGIYFTLQHLGGKVLKNAVHDPSTNLAARNTSNTYGFYIDRSSGTVAKPNLVANNIFYNMLNNGPMYIIYHNGANNWRYHHNSIDIDDMTPTTGLTSVVFFLGASNLIFFTNNIISFRRSGTSDKYLVRIAGTGGKVLNHNGYFIHPLSVNTHFGFQNFPIANIADWRTITTFDTLSLNENPNFVAPNSGLLIPTNGAYDNIGQNLLTLVPDDFQGSARTSAPDPGAFEFLGPPCGNPVNFASSNLTISSLVLSWIQPGNATQWDIEWGLPGFIPGSGTAASASISTNPYSLTGLTPGGCYDIYIRANCVAQGAGTGAWVGLSVCLPAQYDLQIEEILSPSLIDCGAAPLPVAIRIKNGGLLPISGFSFTANITGAATQSLNRTYVGSLAPNATDSVFIGNINLLGGGTISVAVTGNYILDQVLSNNTLQHTAAIASMVPSDIVRSKDTLCANEQIWLTTPSTVGRNNRWYDANNTELGSGDSLLVGPISAPTLIKLTGEAFISDYVGPKDTTFGPAASLSAIAAQRLLVTALKEVTILETTVYPNTGGTLVVQFFPVAPTTGPTISKTVPVSAPSSPGMPVVVPIDLTIPAGNYEMAAGIASTVGGLVRNSDSASYPYGTGDFIITGNTFNPNFYYFFYNIKFAIGVPCQVPADSLILYPSEITFVNNSASGVGLSSSGFTVNFDATGSYGSSFTWRFGDGATGSGVTTSHTYTANGTYTATLVVDGDCGRDSISQTITIAGIGTEDLEFAQNLRVFPNPTTGFVNVMFDLQTPQELFFRVINPVGQQVFERKLGKNAGLSQLSLDLSGYSRGVYLLQIQTEQGFVTRRIALQ